MRITSLEIIPASKYLFVKIHTDKLRNIGIQPDIIVCRTEYPISNEMKAKIALFCNIPANRIIQNLIHYIPH